MRPPKADAVCPLVCEDIRTEASGRLSLMGVFGPSVQVTELPATLPGLSAILIVRNPQEPLTEFTVSVLAPDGKEVVPTTTHHIGAAIAVRVARQFHTKVVPFPVATEGDIRFRFTFNGGDEIGVELPLTVTFKAPPVPAT